MRTVAENLVQSYLTDIGKIRGTRANVPETSFYPALERLLIEVGKSLSHKVRCVMTLANRGAGLPDGGLFSAEQFRRKTRDPNSNDNPFLVQNPSRAVIEAKPPSHDVRCVTEMARRLAALIGLQVSLDANYREVVKATYPWPK
jgi:hypothetical protein